MARDLAPRKDPGLGRPKATERVRGMGQEKGLRTVQATGLAKVPMSDQQTVLETGRD